MNKEEIKEIKSTLKQSKPYNELGTYNYFNCESIEKILNENQELKKQLTTYQILHHDCKVDNLKNISKIEEMENQQKEFIEFLEKMLDNENDIFSVVRVKDVLSKYNEIIGGKQ